ncbi:zinc ribbon domain-containing protein [Bifidobacterium pseudolongum]|uniref:Putative zinc-ribbon domain-containing protein n=1 Tax=Bifidobacterium pseudolongum subsp. globosum TaxID=1690 RepID=A0A8B3RNX0_9BIFI|nr:zinc ribbon domain-containing protein [Bifidobacterium pseudolongum]RYQ47135.1 hypothetical protein PG1780B_0854 [Bifidobacterium pseudolongum subsp. globosum]
MPMIQCPECGTHIADKARICPYCGYVGDDPTQLIGTQAVYKPAPQLQLEIERWDPTTNTMGKQRIDFAPEDNRRIYDAIKDWKWVQTMMPALAEAVTGMARSEKQWIADIPKYCEKLLDDGQIFFNMDKAGRILPELKGENGRFVQKVRLRETVSMPELLPNLQHLETQAALAMIMNQLENVQGQIAQVRGELQQDRLAKADAAWDQLNQALKITDGRRREQAVIIAIGTGTEAKHTLIGTSPAASISSRAMPTRTKHGSSSVTSLRGNRIRNAVKSKRAWHTTTSSASSTAYVWRPKGIWPSATRRPHDAR